MKNIFLILSFLTAFASYSQKKVIDHTAYNSWKKLETQLISNDGNFISYTIKPHRGDGYLYLYNNITAKLDSFPRGYKQQFSGNSSFLIFQITAGFDTLRNCELNKVDEEKWPKDSLAIYLLATDSLIKIPTIKSYSIAETSDWIAYTLEINKLDKLVEKQIVKSDSIKATSNVTSFKNKFLSCIKKKAVKEELVAKPEKKKEEEYKSDGKMVVVFNPFNKKKYEYKDITEMVVSKNGKYVVLTTHKKENKVVSCELSLLETESGNYSTEAIKKTEFKGITFNNSETALAVLSTEDTNKMKQFELNYIDLKSRKWRTLIDTTTASLSINKGISENRIPVFSINDSHLFFGISDRIKKEKKDTLVENEKVKLDLWNYNDTRLQAQQLFELKEDKKKSYLFVYHLVDSYFSQISNDSILVNLPKKPQSDYLFAENIQPYQGTYNWTSPNLKDHYRISLKDGKMELIKREVGFGGELSPSGKYYIYYNGAESNHYLIDITSKKETCLTCSRKDIKWEKDMNGQPQEGEPIGVIGWFKSENVVVLQSEYDIWSYSIAEGKLISITNEEGKTNKTRFTLSLWENDSIYIDYKNSLIKGFNESTKQVSFYELSFSQPSKYILKNVFTMDYNLNALNRSKNGKKIILRRSSVKEYPDLYVLENDFTNLKRISTTNPQQSQYNWSTVEKIEWTSYDGIPLQGLVYKPENYDAEKSYPMIVYYYELHSDEIHNHYAPRPTASVIHPTEYASAGYIVFVPDIRYRIGHPAQSAYDCIMSGTDKILKLYPNIDSKRMGLQGQSWGGYQTAQLITMTTRYAAAMAGAPVSNMISAYGGIRWESGLNRQFQYEKQQSRIGKTLWEAPELYIENSPIFHLPKVNTPLLIMSNDEDGAVPWYQGIELFTGMKRLDKPCWMLNYNGDKHNLMKNANRIDLSIRMRQFFDHYLQAAPAPKWLTDGIPATVKGEEMRYELK